MRKIEYIKFHAPVFYPKIGDLGVTLPSPKKALPDLDMETTDEGGGGVFIRTKGAEVWVPAANVVFGVLYPEAAAVVAPKAKGKA